MHFFKIATRTAAAVAAIAAGITAGVASASTSAHSRSGHKTHHSSNRTHHASKAEIRKHAHRRKKVKRSHRAGYRRSWRHVKPVPTTTSTTTTPTTTATATTSTTSTTSTTTSTPVTTTTGTTTTPTGTPQPVGVSGGWNLAFDDEFNGTSLNTSLWDPRNGWTNQNNVTSYASNVLVAGGNAILTLASNTSGAEIGSQQNVFAVGDYAEARIDFAGSGTTIYNWPAWWVSGPNWPAAGESDIAEGLGTLTVNYHSPSGAHNQGTVPGVWAGAFHTYGIYRGPNYCNVYWDGTLVKSYSTDDNGGAEQLILTMGAANTLQFGAQGQMVVDYVRVWSPA